MSQFTIDQVRATYKARDSWWTVLLVDPLVGRLVQFAAGYRAITPNLLTGVGFVLGLVAAVCFFQASPAWLVAGALLYHVGFMIDCMDGKIARLKGTGSIFGGWMDFFLDRIRVLVCVVALFAGHWRSTGEEVFLFAATAVVFLALFGYVTGAETEKARAKLTAGRPKLDNEALLHEVSGAAAGPAGRIAAALHRRRIRLNLVSGIEFEMAVLIVAPVTAAIVGAYGLLWVTAVAAGLLVLFEAALIGRFWLATRAAARASAPAPALPTDSAAPTDAPAPAKSGEPAVPRPRQGADDAAAVTAHSAP